MDGINSLTMTISLLYDMFAELECSAGRLNMELGTIERFNIDEIRSDSKRKNTESHRIIVSKLKRKETKRYKWNDRTDTRSHQIAHVEFC